MGIPGWLSFIKYKADLLLGAWVGASAFSAGEPGLCRDTHRPGGRDGDTLTLLDAEHTQHKIRLSGIDAPEKAQAFGEPSKQNLSRLVFGKEIEVQWNKRDRYPSDYK